MVMYNNDLFEAATNNVEVATFRGMASLGFRLDSDKLTLCTLKSMARCLQLIQDSSTVWDVRIASACKTKLINATTGLPQEAIDAGATNWMEYITLYKGWTVS